MFDVTLLCSKMGSIYGINLIFLRYYESSGKANQDCRISLVKVSEIWLHAICNMQSLVLK